MVMRARTWLILFCLMLLASEANPQNSVPSVAIPISIGSSISGDISLSLPTLNAPFTVDPATNATALILTNDQYRVGISKNSTAGHTVFHVELQSLSGQPVQLNEMSLQLRFPRENVEGIWSPAIQALEGEL